jgi:hypothetical protein
MSESRSINRCPLARLPISSGEIRNKSRPKSNPTEGWINLLMISSDRIFPRSHRFQTSLGWKPKLQLFEENIETISSAEMGLKQV